MPVLVVAVALALVGVAAVVGSLWWVRQPARDSGAVPWVSDLAAAATPNPDAHLNGNDLVSRPHPRDPFPDDLAHDTAPDDDTMVDDDAGLPTSAAATVPHRMPVARSASPGRAVSAPVDVPRPAAEPAWAGDPMSGAGVQRGATEIVAEPHICDGATPPPCCHVLYLAPGTVGVAHSHHRTDVRITLQRGRLLVLHGEDLQDTATVHPGQTLLVPRGLPHAPVNLSNREPVVGREAGADPSVPVDLVELPGPLDTVVDRWEQRIHACGR